LIPLLNVWLGYRAFACPPGYAYNKKMDGVGILLALIYWLLAITYIAAIIGLVAVMAGSLGTKEQREGLFKMLQIPMEEAQKSAPPATRNP
jgi:hypothetical protein